MGPLCHTRPQSQHAAMLRHHTRRTLKLVSNSKRLNSDDAFRPEPAMAASFMDIGTRRIFNEDHDSFRDMVRKWFEAEVKPHSMQWEKDGMVSREIWENAGENGLLGIPVSDKCGGVGSDILHAAIMWEEQAYANDAGLGFAMHSDIVMPYIEKWGTEEQKNRLLPAMGQGKLIGALAMTEPGAGSDVQGIKTSAKRDGDDWILNGSKTFITNGQMSTSYLSRRSPILTLKLWLTARRCSSLRRVCPGSKRAKIFRNLVIRRKIRRSCSLKTCGYRPRLFLVERAV